MAFYDMRVVGLWNAATNVPRLQSGRGQYGDCYVVSVAGTTSLDGVPSWNVGDLLCFQLNDKWNQIPGGATLAASNATVLYGAQLGVVAGSTGAASSNSSIIASAMQTLDSAGGGELILEGDIFISSPILNSYNRVMVRGPGSGTFHNVSGGLTYGCRIWPTANLSPAVLVRNSPYGGATTAITAGGGFKWMVVEGNSVAQRLLQVDSVVWAEFDLTLQNPEGTEAAKFISGIQGTNFGESPSCQWNDITLKIRCLDTANAKNAHGVVLQGSSNANFSLNYNVRLDIIHWNGDAVRAELCDNNSFYLRAFRAGGTGRTFYSKGVTAANNGGQSSVLEHVSGTGPIVFEGTDTGGVTTGSTGCIITLDKQNGTPDPTLGTGAICPVLNENLNGVTYGMALNKQVISDSIAGAKALRVSAASTTTLTIGNGSTDHIRLTDGTNIWGIDIDGSGNLRLIRLAGSGKVTSSDLAITGNIGFFSHAVGSQPTVTGSRGGNAALASLLTGLASLGLVVDSTTA